MKHRLFKKITDKISELSIHDSGRWTNGCELYMYGNKREFSSRRTKQGIMAITRDGLSFHHIYSFTTNEFGLENYLRIDPFRATVLRIIGIDVV
jgi:hypothetical protein